jgi:hypothetical protein
MSSVRGIVPGSYWQYFQAYVTDPHDPDRLVRIGPLLLSGQLREQGA